MSNKIILIAGARPNFMKIAPLYHEMIKEGMEPIIVHTGQHYDDNMSDIFFKELDIPKADYNLGIGSDTRDKQISQILKKLTPICKKIKPKLIIVVGDTNSTVGAALVAKSLVIPLAHVEAGLRSFDKEMPEETNRIMTDIMSDELFTTREFANENLRKAEISEDKIHFVGNIMIDTLVKNIEKAKAKRQYIKYGYGLHQYGLVTLHRPSNVDSKEKLTDLIELLKEIDNNTPLLFPMHPRTKKQIEKFKIDTGDIRIIEPQGYIEFISLIDGANFILTDSGGIQEEASCLAVPCLTLRENTERPITIAKGTNVLVGTDRKRILQELKELKSTWTRISIPLWDGQTSRRIVEILRSKYGK